jgi:hypothetical protein
MSRHWAHHSRSAALGYAWCIECALERRAKEVAMSSSPRTWLIPWAVTFVVLAAQPSYADALFLGFVTCVTETAPTR